MPPRCIVLRVKWYNLLIVVIEINSEHAMKHLGARLGRLLEGGDVIELVGDVGAGKTTLTKGVGEGLGVTDDIQSPSFTISRVYDARRGLRLAHYDFYRLRDAGIMANELHEVVNDPETITIIEWAEIINGVLPADRLTITITSPAEMERHVTLRAGGEKSARLLKGLES